MRGALEARGAKAVVAVAGGIAVWAATSIAWPNSAPMGVVLQGVVFGTATGLLAMGLVLIWRTNRVINFAYGAMGGVGGVLAVTLFLEAGLPYPLTIAIGLASGLAVGWAVERFVVRRFANSSRLVLTVATIGLAQLLGGIQLLIPSWFGSLGLVGGFETPLGWRVSIDPVLFTGDHMLIVAVVPPVVAGLAWFLLRTDVGIAVRAAADDPDRALLYGIPIRRLRSIVWVVAGGLASLTFILKAPFAGSVSTALGGIASLLLPALAAAVVARMESLPVAFGAGVGLGVVEQLVFWNAGRASAVDVAFLAVILLGLLAGGRSSSGRAREREEGWSAAGVIDPIPAALRRLPEVRLLRWGVVVIGALVAVWLPTRLGPSTVNLISVALLWGMVAVSLVVLTGWGGHISLGQFAIAGAGALAVGNVLVRWQVDLFLVLLLAAAAGGLVALAIGLPALRIRGPFLAATTLAFAVALDSFVLNPTIFPDLVPGAVERPVLWDRFPLDGELAMYYLCLTFLVGTVFAVRGIKRARAGRVLVAMRDNDRAAAAAGVPTTAAKLGAFVLSGVIAGLAGGLYILVLRGARAGTFQPPISLEVFSTAVIGGLGSVGGALAGVFSVRTAERLVSGELRLLLTGTGLLAVLMLLPGGLGQAYVRLRDAVLTPLASRRGIDVSRAPAPEGAERELLEGALEEREPAEVGR